MFDPGAPQGRKHRTELKGLKVMGKRQVVKQQLLSQHIWLAGFQETRLPTTGVLPDADFYMYNVAANDAGQGGCSVWINKACPYATDGGKELFVLPEHVTVASSSPRHIALRIEAPRLHLVVLVAHCPRASAQGCDTPLQFWRRQLPFLTTQASGAEVIILADANGHLGDVVTEAVSSVGAEVEDEAGRAFHDLLLEVGCFLPSTTEVHQGPHPTWYGPDATVCHRIDYVARSGYGGGIRSWLPGFGCLLRPSRHAKITCLLALRLVSRGRPPPASYIRARRQSCRPALDDKGKEAVLAAFTALPPVDWATDIDQHFSAWTARGQTRGPTVLQPGCRAHYSVILDAWHSGPGPSPAACGHILEQK